MRRRDLSFVTEIVGWWTEHGRDFPWRSTTDPFKVLVAEMLLQRSRSVTVAKIYLQLFERWPTQRELADADISELKDLIRPLGFQNRASRIKAVAVEWSERATPPNTRDELQELAGVGPYSANATAIALSWAAKPCVDSVSIRVLRRYIGNQNMAHSDQKVASRAYSPVPKDRWRELNWAILDLAAAKCLPRIPRCQCCPLKDRCKTAGKSTT
jgi:A/G-specific adenine glycosylase